MASTTLDPDKVRTVSTIRRACTDGRLRKALREAKLSGTEAACGAGISQWTLSRWLTGADVPSAALALNLAEFLEEIGVMGTITQPESPIARKSSVLQDQ